jgi:hypothetical protein
LIFLFWNNTLVLGTGKNIYLIDENLNVKTSLDVTTPLIGLYLVNNEKLLLLEESYVRVVNYNGEIIKSELFDLIENFNINPTWQV